ncbi:MAG: hypothetical protein C0599_16385 [Salinivirgaceae bacterium]|nr:MAG: hypothetical protein C0599_16385 [Salinivirgaceae bacterium]
MIIEKNIGNTKDIFDATVVSAIPALRVESPIKKNVKTNKLPTKAAGQYQSNGISATFSGVRPALKYPNPLAMK